MKKEIPEEDLVKEMIDNEFIVKIPPKNRYSRTVKINRIIRIIRNGNNCKADFLPS